MFRCLLRPLVAVILLATASWAQALVFAVNEGVTYRVPVEEIRAKYAPLAAEMSRLLQQPVTIEPVSSYPKLREGLAAKAYDLALVHPAHLSIVAIRDSGYRLLAVTKGFQEYKASFMVPADSPLTSLASLKGRRLGAPDEDSITSWMVRATLRDTVGEASQVAITYTRYQDAVPFMVENTFTHAGASASSGVVKGWVAKGGKVLATTRAVPIKHVIAGPALSADQVAKLRDYLVGLDQSDEGRRVLAPIKYSGFAVYDQAAMLEIGRWLGL